MAVWGIDAGGYGFGGRADGDFFVAVLDGLLQTLQDRLSLSVTPSPRCVPLVPPELAACPDHLEHVHRRSLRWYLASRHEGIAAGVVLAFGDAVPHSPSTSSGEPSWIVTGSTFPMTTLAGKAAWLWIELISRLLVTIPRFP